MVMLFNYKPREINMSIPFSIPEKIINSKEDIQEMLGGYIDNIESSIEFLKDLRKVSNDNDLIKFLDVSPKTFNNWIEGNALPKKTNANKIMVLYFITFDQTMFLTVMCSFINKINKDMYGEISTKKTLSLVQHLYSIRHLKNCIIINGYVNSLFNAKSYLWYFIDDLFLNLYSFDYGWAYNKNIANYFHSEIKETDFPDKINKFREFFNVLGILDDLEEGDNVQAE